MSKSRDWEGVCDGGDTGTKTTKEKKRTRVKSVWVPNLRHEEKRCS